MMDLPQKVLDTIGRNPSGSVVVKRFMFDDLKVITPDRLDILEENRVDKARAAVSSEIGAVYELFCKILTALRYGSIIRYI